jgi:hypothetical protein
MRFSLNGDGSIHDAAFPRNVVITITTKSHPSTTEREYAEHICRVLNAGAPARAATPAVQPETRQG